LKAAHKNTGNVLIVKHIKVRTARSASDRSRKVKQHSNVSFRGEAVTDKLFVPLT